MNCASMNVKHVWVVYKTDAKLRVCQDVNARVNGHKRAIASFARHANYANHVKLIVNLMVAVAKPHVYQVGANLYVKYMLNLGVKTLAKMRAKAESA